MYKHIFWDFDGTLFDTYPVSARNFQESLKNEYGINEDISIILSKMKVSMPHAYNYFKDKLGISDEFIKRYKAVSNEREIELAKPFDGIQTICRTIHEHGCYNYLYTHRGKSAYIIMEKYDLYSLFTDYITSEDGFEWKPSPQALLYMIDKHGIKPNEALMVGDREIDILSGKNAGIDACLFTEDVTAESKADFIIRDFNELYGIIGL